uniref:DNA-directed RNA polymerases I and III subunit RPAC2 n=1 Tax=Oryzias latipes TaxID=8090 RepID=A0A3P9L9S3_ORYLA
MIMKCLFVQADGAQEDCVTFVMHDEDHTLGNSLRYMIMKNPDVDFCGYTITHPSESKINFRIQTRGGVPAVEPLQKGLSDLHQVCQHVLNTFQVPPCRHFLVFVCPLQLKQKKGKKRNLKAGGSGRRLSFFRAPFKSDQNNEEGGLETWKGSKPELVQTFVFFPSSEVR